MAKKLKELQFETPNKGGFFGKVLGVLKRRESTSCMRGLAEKDQRDILG